MLAIAYGVLLKINVHTDLIPKDLQACSVKQGKTAKGTSEVQSCGPQRGPVSPAREALRAEHSGL